MVSKMYLAMTLAMGLNNVFAEEASEPKYLWRECHTGSSRNLYDSQLEVDNVYENETIRMADYAGQVKYLYLKPILPRGEYFLSLGRTGLKTFRTFERFLVFLSIQSRGYTKTTRFLSEKEDRIAWVSFSGDFFDFLFFSIFYNKGFKKAFFFQILRTYMIFWNRISWKDRA